MMLRLSAPAAVLTLFKKAFCDQRREMSAFDSASACACGPSAVAPDRSMADRAEDNKAPTRNAPNSDREPRRPRGPDDRLALPHRDEMNRKTVPGRESPPHHGPLPSRIASQRRNHRPQQPSTDFCNKIGPKRTRRPPIAAAAFGGKADIHLDRAAAAFDPKRTSVASVWCVT